MIVKLISKLFPPKCRHLRVRESMSCDAWCRDCGKNLGFIAHWREANRGNPEASESPNDPGCHFPWRPMDEAPTPHAGKEG